MSLSEEEIILIKRCVRQIKIGVKAKNCYMEETGYANLNNILNSIIRKGLLNLDFLNFFDL